jgi:hypothetical protein
MALDTFLKDHERLIIVVLVLVFGVFLTYKGLGLVQALQQSRATQLENQLAQTEQQATAAKEAALQAQAQVTAAQQAAAQDKAASAAIISALSAQNASLNQTIATQDKQTAAQQTTDLHSTIPQLGQRFVDLVPNVDPKDIVVAADQKSVTIGQDTAEKAVAQLELIPGLQADNKNLQAEIANDATMQNSLQKALNSESQYADSEARLVTTEEKYTALLQTQIDQANKVCDEKISVEKTKAKKSFLKGLGIGAVVGFIGGLFAHGI